MGPGSVVWAPSAFLIEDDDMSVEISPFKLMGALAPERWLHTEKESLDDATTMRGEWDLAFGKVAG